MQQARPRKLRSERPDQSHTGIIDFQASVESESRKRRRRRKTGYPGTAFSRQSLRNANHQPARMRLVPKQKRGGGGLSCLQEAILPPKKEQGRQRSIPQTALPAPDIEIGLRRPVNYTLPGETAGRCEPVHTHRKKVAASPWGRAGRARSGLGRGGVGM